MTHPTVTCSVVIATYQRTDILPLCLDALGRQEVPPDEIIVVARDTDTATQELAATWIALDPQRHKLAIVHRPGQVAAMEAGVRASTGAIVAFTDDDAQPRPDWTRRLLAHYADPTVGGVGGRDVLRRDGVLLDGSLKRVGYISWYGRVTGGSHLEWPGVQEVVTMKGVNMSFRRHFIEFDPLMRGTPTIWPSDTSICLNAVRKGARLLCDPQILVDHYEFPRKKGDERMTVYPEAYAIKSHNITYLVLKYLPWYCWPPFILYSILVGQKNTPGVLYDVTHKQLPRWNILRASFAGKWAGFWTYWRWWAQQRYAQRVATQTASSHS
jgi:glycosyltransferase involved in cell wall biosynthesis